MVKKLLLLLSISPLFSLSQEVKPIYSQVPLAGEIDMNNLENDFLFRVDHLEPPVPGGNSTKSHLMEIKKEVNKRFPRIYGVKSSQKTQADAPVIVNGFALKEYTPGGTELDFIGGIPNDNALAFSNDGIVLSAVNSRVFGFDLKTDTFLFPSVHVSLASISPGGNNVVFVPKLIYDPDADRFVLAFLEGRTPGHTFINVAFSKTNDPNDGWNVYKLEGNPFNNNRWTDFPAISLTGDAVVVTGNLIVPGEPWQTGFDGSIIYMMKKQEGYNGAANVSQVLFPPLTYSGKYLRNLHPIRGAMGNAEKQFVLSNRNFDVQNDTTFLVEIIGDFSTPNLSLSISPVIADVPYGVPPNGQQADTDPNDPTEGLQTNDARVLAGILIEDNIQFVSNSVNPATGLSSIYHGVIENASSTPSLTAQLITDPTRDFGYPNIAFTGNEMCDKETVIAFNHTSVTDFAGISCIYFDNDGNYSNVVTIKEGENYIDRLQGGYERWGDYFGIQRAFNDETKVFTGGYFGLASKKNSVWINELMIGDTTRMFAEITLSGTPGFCSGVATVTAQGQPPFVYDWSNGNTNDVVSGVCLDDTLTVTITDSRGCSSTKTVVAGIVKNNNAPVLYPNPTSDRMAIQLEVPNNGLLLAEISDMSGKIVYRVGEKTVKAGLNEVLFSLAPLSSGPFIVRIYLDNKILYTEKIMKD